MKKFLAGMVLGAFAVFVFMLAYGIALSKGYGLLDTVLAFLFSFAVSFAVVWALKEVQK